MTLLCNPLADLCTYFLKEDLILPAGIIGVWPAGINVCH